MLVLSRREFESFYIGDDIKVTVVRINKDVVRFGVEAPKDVPIVREELKQTEKPQ